MIGNQGILLQAWLNAWNAVKNTLGVEFLTNRDASDGYPSLSGYALKLKNSANTFTSTLSNATTAARAWVMPDKDGTVAMTSDIVIADINTSGILSTGTQYLPSGKKVITGGGLTNSTNALEVHNSTGSSNSLIIRDDKWMEFFRAEGTQLRIKNSMILGGSGEYGLGFFQDGTSNFVGQIYGAANGFQFTDGGGGGSLFVGGGSRVGIGLSYFPGYTFEIYNDSAGKPGSALWTIVSDERIKDIEGLADLDRCYEIVKNVPLKRYRFKDSAYTDSQINDRNVLGFIAQDVQKVFKNAVSEQKITLNTGKNVKKTKKQHAYEIKLNEKVEIKIINGVATQIKYQEEEKVYLYDYMPIFDEYGNQVIDENGNPIFHKADKIIDVEFEEFENDVINDGLNLNSDQMLMACYGAVQKLMQKVETLEKELVRVK